MFVGNAQQCFAYTPQVNFPAHNLNFHWRWRWWDQIHATSLNLFYFTFYIDFFAILAISWLFHGTFWRFFTIITLTMSESSPLTALSWLDVSFKFLISSSLSLRSDSNSSSRDFRPLNSETALKSQLPEKKSKKRVSISQNDYRIL